jgi:hypothetical protein
LKLSFSTTGDRMRDREIDRNDTVNITRDSDVTIRAIARANAVESRAMTKHRKFWRMTYPVRDILSHPEALHQKRPPTGELDWPRDLGGPIAHKIGALIEVTLDDNPHHKQQAQPCDPEHHCEREVQSRCFG